MELVTTDWWSDRLGVARSTITRWANAGDVLPTGLRIGRAWYWDRSVAQAHFEELRAKGHPRSTKPKQRSQRFIHYVGESTQQGAPWPLSPEAHQQQNCCPRRHSY